MRQFVHDDVVRMAGIDFGIRREARRSVMGRVISEFDRFASGHKLRLDIAESEWLQGQALPS